MLKARQSQTSITSLKFLDGTYVAAGCGMFLKIYNWQTSQLVNSRQIFYLNKIHGIEKLDVSDSNPHSTPLLILWGGNELVVVDQTLAVHERHKIKDRVVHVQSFEGSLYVLTAHNEVLIVKGGNEVQRVLCDERSTLYSGTLFITNEKMLVASGTIFGGVVVWDLITRQVLRRFEHHEGSIFDVAWNEDGTLIASCSDDRAIIISDLASGNTVAKGWGHISRIWRLRFVPNKPLLVSVAEDSSVRLWTINLQTQDLENDSLLCTKIMSGHKGKSVWGVDVHNDIAVTGGGDGRIVLWDLLVSNEHVLINTESFLQKGNIRSCLVLDGKTSEDYNAAITTGNGQTFIRKGCEWKALGGNLGNAAVAKKHGNRLYVISDTGNGICYNMCNHECKEIQLGYAVLRFFVLSEDLLLIVPTMKRSEFILHPLAAEIQDEIYQLPSMIGSPACVLLLTSQSLICVGSTKGDIFTYRRGNGEPLAISISALGQDTVTSLGTIEQGNETVLVATSRVSEYGLYELDTLKCLTRTRSRKKGSIEGQASNNQGKIFWGFQNDNFVVWNATLGLEYFTSQCGGAHRSWNFSVSENCSKLLYTRNSKLYEHRIELPSPKFGRPILQFGTHGREIRGMETCPTNPLLLAMASEDTTISLGWINSNYENFEPKTVITDGHISGIQALHWHPGGDRFFTGAGQGELVMWNVQVLGTQIFATEASRMPVKGTVQEELRVMDFAFFENYVAVAYSDSSFRIWQLVTKKEKCHLKPDWELVLEGRYHECCLLNIDLVQWNHQLWLLISATDGHLIGYSLKTDTNSRKILSQSCQDPKFRTKIHQSSVRASEIVIDEPSRSLYYYSGGDDNAFHKLELYYDENSEVVIGKELFHIAGAHASAITQIIAKHDRVFTVGSDQQIKCWHPSGDLETAAYTGVSDTGVLVVQDHHAITGGLGIEFFDYFAKS